jgi:hypothetical protein
MKAQSAVSRACNDQQTAEACIMTEKLDVGKALDKLRGNDTPKSRMTLLDEKNKVLDEELRRLRAERRRLERDNPGPPKRD